MIGRRRPAYGCTVKIVAIGGGEIGRPGYPVETTELDADVVRLALERHISALVFTACSSDAPLGIGPYVTSHFHVHIHQYRAPGRCPNGDRHADD